MTELTDPTTVYSTATVTVSEAVDGKKKRKQKPGGPCPDCGTLFGTLQGLSMHKTLKHAVKTVVAATLSLDDVDPRIAAAARKIRKRGQVIVVVSPELVRVVNQ